MILHTYVRYIIVWRYKSLSRAQLSEPEWGFSILINESWRFCLESVSIDTSTENNVLAAVFARNNQTMSSKMLIGAVVGLIFVVGALADVSHLGTQAKLNCRDI